MEQYEILFPSGRHIGTIELLNDENSQNIFVVVLLLNTQYIVVKHECSCIKRWIQSLTHSHSIQLRNLDKLLEVDRCELRAVLDTIPASSKHQQINTKSSLDGGQLIQVDESN